MCGVYESTHRRLFKKSVERTRLDIYDYFTILPEKIHFFFWSVKFLFTETRIDFFLTISTLQDIFSNRIKNQIFLVLGQRFFYDFVNVEAKPPEPLKIISFCCDKVWQWNATGRWFSPSNKHQTTTYLKKRPSPKPPFVSTYGTIY